MVMTDSDWTLPDDHVSISIQISLLTSWTWKNAFDVQLSGKNASSLLRVLYSR